MSNKTKLILIIAVALLLLLSAAILFINANKPEKTDTDISVERAPETGDLKNEIPTAVPKLSIAGQSGFVETSNFLKNVQLQFGGYVEFWREGNYVFGFDGSSQNFYIKTQALDLTEFNQTRSVAEVQFIALLGIPTTDACKLKVEIQNGAAPDAPEIDYFRGSLSFCSN